MSIREQAIDLIAQIPDYKMSYVVAFLQGASIPDDIEYIPNAETIEAIEELENGGGHRFEGTTQELFEKLLK